jgi:hypothetical protein
VRLRSAVDDPTRPARPHRCDARQARRKVAAAALPSRHDAVANATASASIKSAVKLLRKSCRKCDTKRQSRRPPALAGPDECRGKSGCDECSADLTGPGQTATSAGDSVNPLVEGWEAGSSPARSRHCNRSDEAQAIAASHSGRPGKAGPSQRSESQDTPFNRDPTMPHGRWGEGSRHSVASARSLQTGANLPARTGEELS